MFSRYWNNFSFILLSISQAEEKAEEEAGENLEIAFNPFDANVYFDA